MEHAQQPILPSKQFLWLIIAGFFLLTFGVYGQSLDNPFVRWDDGLLIYENPAIRAINVSTLRAIFTTYDPELYIPLTLFTYQIDFLIGGIKPAIYHLHNLFYHTGNALLVAWFAWLLLRRGWIALLCGVLFAIHPLHTEAVAWASARKDLVSTFFFLFSLNTYLVFRKRHSRTWYLASIGCFVLALLAKVTVIVLPILLLAIDWREKRPLDRTMILEKIPYLALSIIFGIIAFHGKTGALALSTWSEKILMAFRSTAFYLQKLIVPTELSVLYPYTQPIVLTQTDILFSIIALCVLGVIALLSLRKTREIAFGLFFFLVAIAPTFANFMKGDGDAYMASDRYAYAGSIGILLLVVLFVHHLWMHSHGPLRKAITGAIAGITVLLAALSFLQARTWESTEALFRNVLAHYPESHVAHANLGNVERRVGNIQEAITLYEAALAIQEHHRTLSNLGSAYRQLRDHAKALSSFTRALELNASSVEAHTGMGLLHAQMGNPDEAQKSYEQAIALNPYTSLEARLNLGALFAQNGDYEAALKAYDEALVIDPYFPHAHFNRAVALEKLNKTRDAVAAYKEALALEPSFVAARINLGIALANRRELDEAIEQFTIVLQYDPTNQRALSALKQLGER